LFVALAGPSPAADETAEDAGRIEDPQQVHGRVPVKPWFERAFAKQRVDDVTRAGVVAPIDSPRIIMPPGGWALHPEMVRCLARI
jgi:hypothetical protein